MVVLLLQVVVVMYLIMETPTHPLQAKTVLQTAGDEPTLSTALWVLGGFIVFAAIIFFLVIYSPL